MERADAAENAACAGGAFPAAGELREQGDAGLCAYGGEERLPLYGDQARRERTSAGDAATLLQPAPASAACAGAFLRAAGGITDCCESDELENPGMAGL